MKYHLNFLACDGGCFGSGTPSGIVPPTAGQNIICDDRLMGLVLVPRMQLVGVKPGSNCLTALQAKRGFVFSDDSGFYVEDSPSLTLPAINPAASGVFPASGSFQYLIVGTGSAPHGWRFAAAPSTGSYLVQSLNGAFSFIDAGSIPGLNSTCGAPGASTVVSLIGCAATGSLDGSGNPIFAARKLAALEKRVVVGYLDPSDSVTRFRSLPDGTPLEHPRGNFDVLSPKTIQAREDDGTDTVGGLPVMPVTGGGAITDGVPCVFSPTTKRLYRAPERVKYYVSRTNVVNGNAGAGYAALPGSHMIAAAQTFNYPAAMIIGTLGFAVNEAVNIALFRDNALLHEFTFFVGNNLSLTYLDSAIPQGNHTYDFRWKKDPGSTNPAATVTYSDVSIISLP